MLSVLCMHSCNSQCVGKYARLGVLCALACGIVSMHARLGVLSAPFLFQHFISIYECLCVLTAFCEMHKLIQDTPDMMLMYDTQDIYDADADVWK